jgi:hydrogenase-4 component B
MTTLVAAVVVLFVGAILCLLPVHNRARAAIGIASQALATVLVLSTVLPILFGNSPKLVGDLPWAYPVGVIRIEVDALGAFFLAWSLPMTLLGSVYATGYLASHFAGPRNLGVHFALLNLTSLSFVLVYTGAHALIFLLGWEVAAIAAWLLVIWDYRNQKVRFAGFNYLVSTHLGLLFLVAAFMILYTHAGSWHLSRYGAWLQATDPVQRGTVFILLVTSFGLKSAFFPFHSWLPRAHSAAPAHVSALMSGVIHKAGLYALVRFLLLIGRPDEWMGWFLIAFSATSALVGALYTVNQRDLKRLLGYSSTENVGIAGMGFGLGCLGLSWEDSTLVALGFASGLLHVLNHAWFKCQLFYAAGSVYRATHTVDMERLGGLSRVMPWTARCFLLGGLAISGLPPLNGFASEFLIYSGLFPGKALPFQARLALTLAGAVLAFVGAVSALSITRAFGVTFLGAPRDPAIQPRGEAPLSMGIPMAIHAAFVVLLGLVPTLGLLAVTPPAALALAAGGFQSQQSLSTLAPVLQRIGIVSGVCLLAILLAVWLRHRLLPKPAGTHHTWGCGYQAVGPRMQYGGTSFSASFAGLFRAVLVVLRREKRVEGYFPSEGHVHTHCVDAVERRLFEIIGRGDQAASIISRKLGEDQPRVAFAAGLIALLVICALVLVSEGKLP